MSATDERSCDLFRLAVEFGSTSTVLRLEGELDRATAPELTKIIDVLVERRGLMLLDVAELDFIDASGLNLLAVAARNLAAQGEALVLRDASTMLRRLLDLTGLRDLVRFESVPPDLTLLGAEDPGDDASGNRTRTSEQSVREISRDEHLHGHRRGRTTLHLVVNPSGEASVVPTSAAVAGDSRRSATSASVDDRAVDRD